MSVELRRAHCLVREFLPSDAPSMAACANDRRIWLGLRDLFPHPYALSDADTYIARVAQLHPPQSLAIVVQGCAVGAIALELMTDVNRHSAEVGYWLGADYWGRGIAAEALGAVTPWALQTFDLLRIFAQPFADNLASRRVLEKAGYALEGRMRHSAVKDGVILDQCLYAWVQDASSRQ